ncbi:hypothetical protein PLANPX_4831 [Lacipirellula parvula]|uniref:Uncharacterized protein n=1 Tax=Lacipirellula parvula TaxID=2650471 RepID=A0A5K7XPE4_9BACT|nr:hypothetical protein PLANPX_4831 [Lacipirellula parvula]
MDGFPAYGRHLAYFAFGTILFLTAAGCGHRTVTKVTAPTTAGESPIPIELAGETWRGLWECSGNGMLLKLSISVRDEDGELRGTMVSSAYPNIQTLHLYDMQAYSGGLLRYSVRFGDELDASNEGVVDALINVGTSTVRANRTPSFSGFLRLNDDGTATAFQLSPGAKEWVMLEENLVKHKFLW